MSKLAERIAGLSAEQRAVLEERLKSKSGSSRRDTGDRIAVLGIGCRFPGGADGPEGYWRMLTEGVDAITEVPDSRWDAASYYDEDVDAAGKMNTRWGGFIDRIDQFDAAFFGISPREATSMDPQQRLLLELAWEALEVAGQPVDTLAGSRTGVFIGLHSHSSEYHLFQLGDIGPYTGTGTAHSIAANRLSYCFDLRGPSLTVDTACSSSLVAVHLACESLRHGESDLALAGGVNLMLSPEATIACSKLQMMALDGRCKTFDRTADGFVRGEGCGIVVLKRLSDALADGDDVLAVIAGTAVNQDGRTNGLTAPNGLSQEAVIRDALEHAGVSGADISYIEAHGTGTALGDPIEVGALASVLSPGRLPGRSCILGSVKTNIGHLEGAAGIAGLIKVVLCLQHGTIPPHLHFEEPNPHLSLASTPFSINPSGCPWPVAAGGRFAAVSSFGFGGTNAHAVLAEAPPRRPPARETAHAPERAYLLPISARSPEALRSLAERYRTLVVSDLPEGTDLADVCGGAALRRTHHDLRLAVVARSPEELAKRLDDYLEGRESPSLLGPASARDSRDEGRVLVFSGQGSQWVGMGLDLLEVEPVFAEVLESCDQLLQQHAGWSLFDELRADREHSRMEETEVAQPLIFALQVGLAALWRSWGVQPDAVVGHSVGEIAAAHTCGALGLEDAVRLVCARGRIMQKAAGSGRMLALEVSETETAQMAAELGAEVSIAAVNGPRATVLSGDAAALEALHHRLAQQDIASRLLTGSHAFHSPAMEPLRAELVRTLAGLSPRAGSIPMISTVTGARIDGTELGPQYWGDNMCRPVRFLDAIERLVGTTHRTFVELGPHPVLTAPIAQCLEARGAAGTAVASLRRERQGGTTMRAALGRLYVDGVLIDWKQFHAGGTRPVPLPRYPWQHRRYWLEQASQPLRFGAPSVPERSGGTVEDTHPLLGRRTDAALPTFESKLRGGSSQVAATHWIHGIEVVPLTHFLEMVDAAAEQVFGRGMAAVDDVTMETALALADGDERDVQLVLLPREDTPGATFQLFSRAAARLDGIGAESGWLRHLNGTLRLESTSRDVEVTAGASLDAIRGRCSQPRVGDDYYRQLRDDGYTFSPAGRVIDRLRVGNNEALGDLRRGGRRRAPGTTLDLVFGGLQLLYGALPVAANGTNERVMYAPTAVGRVRIGRQTLDSAVAHLRVRQHDASGYEARVDLDVLDPHGQTIAEVRDLRLSRVRPESLLRRPALGADWIYEVEWRPLARPEEDGAAVVDPIAIADRLMGSTATEANPTGFDELLPEMDTLCASYVLDAIAELGAELRPGVRLDPTSLADELGVQPRHRPLFQRMFSMLVDEGLASAHGELFEMLEEPGPIESERLRQYLCDRHPAFHAELSLLGRCGAQLAGTLAGKCDPIGLLFPNGSLDAVEHIYGRSPQVVGDNRLVGRVVAEATRIWQEAGREVRILELGAGTGGTTASVLPLLPEGGVEYVFSDVSSRFLSSARERFAPYRFVRYRTVDVERPAEEQEIGGERFDLVVAANVLHATADLRRTLQHVRELLAPGGILVLFEATKPQRWIDLTFGLTEGWWRFTDHDLRPEYPLLSRHGWLALLADAGFGEIASLKTTGETDDDEPLKSLLVARKLSASVTEPTSTRPSSWIVCTDAAGIGDALSVEIGARGDRVVRVQPGDAYESLGDGEYRIDPARREHIHRLFEDVTAEGAAPEGVVHLWSLDAPGGETLGVADLEVRGPSGCGSLLLFAQECIAARATVQPKLWAVTRGAQRVASSDTETAVAQAPAWGLGRGIALEHPEAWGGLLDLDPAGRDERQELRAAARHLWEHIESGEHEDQVAYRRGLRYVPRLVRKSQPPGAVRAVPLRRDAAYLVTGGLGRLGLEVARWAAEKGAGHLVLVGRTGLPERAAWDGLDPDSPDGRRTAAIRRIENGGTKVSVVTTDIGEPRQTQQLLEWIRGQAPLRGILHAAGVTDPCPVDDMALEDLAATMRPKLHGAWLLHQLSGESELDFFVLFSSTTALLGARGLSHYAAANHFLDALARHRSDRGLPALSVNWGTWDVMHGINAAERDEVLRHGLRPMEPESALGALDEWIGRQSAEVIIADIDWDVLRPAYEARRPRPLLSELGTGRPTRESTASPATASMLEELHNASPDDRRRLLERYVGSEVARVLGMDEDGPVDTQRGLFEMGLDSLGSASLTRRLESGIGRDLPSTLAFNHATVEALVAYLYPVIWPDDVADAGDSESDAEENREELTTASAYLSEDELSEQLAERLRRLR